MPPLARRREAGYLLSVKPSCPPRICCILLAAGLLLLNFSASSQTKQIRLRTGTITTPPGGSAATTIAAAAQPVTSALSAKTPASGLFLVQFEGALQSADRSQLQVLGVDLLKYVPDDAFIAKFNGVSPASVRALNFVRWVGPYGSDYKIHPRLAALARNVPKTNRMVAVNILISPGAASTEIAGVRSLLSSVQHESDLRQGVILRGNLDAAQLPALAQSGSVLWIEPARSGSWWTRQRRKLSAAMTATWRRRH